MGYVVVRGGVMATCYIIEGEKVVRQGEPAYKILKQYSEWHMQLQNEQQAMPPPSVSSPGPPPATSYSQPLPPIKSGPLAPAPGPNFSAEQSPAPKPGSPSGPLPTFRRGPISGQGPPLYPSPPNNQSPTQRPYTPDGQRPGQQRSNVPMNWFPVMKRGFSQEEFMAIPSRQRMVIRMVLTMVNGRRNVEEIKAQLQLSPGTVESVLEYLRALNIIE
ncbi:hypothetical protein [Dictyobacter halimunensis]